MKKFLKIFIFLEVILFAYIFNTSIYNIYEKNNIATENLKGYVLEETSPEILDKFYTIFTEEYSQNKLELINNTLTSTDKSVYDLYCYPLNEFTQKQPISSSILFQSSDRFLAKEVPLYCPSNTAVMTSRSVDFPASLSPTTILIPGESSTCSLENLLNPNTRISFIYIAYPPDCLINYPLVYMDW